MAQHDLDPTPQFLWSTDHDPRLVVRSGDTVSLRAREALNGQLDHLDSGDPLPDLNWESVYPLCGPIRVEDARPGDVLEIEVLDVVTEDWGWTAVLPGLGLLSDDFPDAHFHRWNPDSGAAEFHDVARVPLRPFFGVIGVCPDVIEPTPVLPPGRFGGNLDCRDLVVGSKLYLPVYTEGARLAIGDPHAAQGDGEVCVSAIEASASGSVKLWLHRDRSIRGPQFQTPGPLRSGLEEDGYYATMGIGNDLMRASQDALRTMVDHLSTTYRIYPIDAYVLSSTVVDLKITEIVDSPNWVVSAYLPLGVMV